MMLVLTLRGTPFWYYGDELGMLHGTVDPKRMRDRLGLTAAEMGAAFDRDVVRAPMPWDRSPNAGFSRAGVETWLPLARDSGRLNVAGERADPASMLQPSSGCHDSAPHTRPSPSGATDPSTRGTPGFSPTAATTATSASSWHSTSRPSRQPHVSIRGHEKARSSCPRP